MTLEHSLRRALERDELLLHYQPQVDIRTGETRGSEALVRWQHPEYGLVPPGKFISLAEETGLIVPMSKWILKAACARNKAWQEAGYLPISIAVNISAKHFHEEDLARTIAKVLADTGLDPQYLELELTESALMQNPEVAVDVLGKLKQMGVRISVDDFGTGYSSLSYLKRFPIDAVKIDQSFVRDITTNPDDAAIAGAVVAMAHSLKLRVIAEGVETLEQLEFLRSLKCDEIQGYFISRPVIAADFVGHLSLPHGPSVNAFRPAA
ncbi:MAG: EAL domain-containing protein [Armatimonadetes bacterium]|nr:EAL domain-containing protein [Armatimonadota bacterium]